MRVYAGLVIVLVVLPAGMAERARINYPSGNGCCACSVNGIPVSFHPFPLLPFFFLFLKE